MTIRRDNVPGNGSDRPVMLRIGSIIRGHRRDLMLRPPTRDEFISSGTDFGLPCRWISEKSLANIENGLNMPSLRTLYNLSLALQIDAGYLFTEISSAFPSHGPGHEPGSDPAYG